LINYKDMNNPVLRHQDNKNILTGVWKHHGGTPAYSHSTEHVHWAGTYLENIHSTFTSIAGKSLSQSSIDSQSLSSSATSLHFQVQQPRNSAFNFSIFSHNFSRHQNFFTFNIFHWGFKFFTGKFANCDSTRVFL